MTKVTQLAAGLAVLGLVFIIFKPTDSLPEKGNLTQLSIKGVSFQVAVAATSAEQVKGLSGRQVLAENEGMIFVYPVPTRPSFWMKEMNFPIDIIWIDADKKIVEVTAKVSPDTFPQAFRPPRDILYVLEVNSGLAEKYGWQAGERVELSTR